MTKLLVALLLLFFICNANAQHDSTDYKLLKEAYRLQKDVKRDSAIIYFEKASAAFKESKNWKKYIECLSGENRNYLRTDRIGDVEAKGKEALRVVDTGEADELDEYVIEILTQLSRLNWYAKGNFPESLKYLDRAKKICDQIDIDKRRIQVYTEYGYTYGYSGDFNQSTEYFKKALDLALLEYGNDSEVVADRYTDMVFPLIQKAEWEKAELALKNAIALNIRLRGPDHMSVLKNYNNLGFVYLEKFDNDLAILYLNKAIQMIREKFSENHRSVGIGYMNLGASYSNKGEFRNGIFYSQKALENLKVSIGEKSPYMALCLVNLGNEYNHLEIYDSAELYYDRALRLRYELFGENHHEVVNLLGYLSNLYFETKRYDEAFASAKKAHEIASNILPVKHTYSANNHIHMSKYYAAVGQYQKSLNEAQLAIMGLLPEYDDENYASTPSLNQDIISTRILIEILIHKTQVLHKFFNENQGRKYLELAGETAKTTDRALDILRIEYQTPESKEVLLTRSKPFYEEAIDIEFQLFDQTGHQEYLENAFRFFEKSKSILLIENVKSSKDFAANSLPDSIAMEEKALSRSLVVLKEQVFEAKTKEDTAQIASLENEVFQKKRDYDLLLNFIQDNYPDYYSIQHNNISISLAETQYNLDTTNLVIEYFYGENDIYALAITHKAIAPFRFANSTEISKRITSLLQSLENRECDEFISYELYTTILNPIFRQDQFKNKTELTFIPDGILHYLPFEVLVASLAQQGYEKYLINDYTINYLHSASLSNLYHHKESKDIAYLGFSPEYSRETNPLLASRSARDAEIASNLVKLPMAEQEVLNSAAIWKGDSYLNENATEENFKKLASYAGIIHIASHAIIDDKNPMNSKLVFSPEADTLEDGLLHTYELYNMKLQAQLACLSACNTGFGQLKSGEGVVSLAKGFFYAGVPNVMMSLWSVPDISTSDIMTYFYEELKNGAGKADALRNAKLTYLKTSDVNTSDPYYWAAFTMIGDNEPLSTSSNFPYKMVGGFLVLAVFSGFLYKKLNSH